MLFSPRRFLVAACVLLPTVLGFSADTSQPKPTPQQIAQWIEQLGDNDFKARERASKKLWQAGAAAEAALEQAVKSDDKEVVRRARELLDKFQWGIYPDTPEDVIAFIRAYQQSGEVGPRLEVLDKLIENGEPGLRAALKIAAAEKDENRRQLLGDAVAKRMPSAWLLVVTEGKYVPFERLLELGHEGKFLGHNPYAVYWLLRGKLPERIAHFRDRLSKRPQDEWLAGTLAYLHRANGDLSAARKAAAKSGNAELLEGILYELGDWKALAERPAAKQAADKGIHHIMGAENLAEKWAFRAAHARLAGKQKEFENAVSELRKCSEGREDRESLAFVAARGLLLNDQPIEGLELLRTIPSHRNLLFELLSTRLDFAGALDLAAKAGVHKKELSTLDLARARLLCRLGEKEGETLFERYAERIKDEVDPQFVEPLLREEMRAGLQDRAIAHAAKAMSVAPPKNRKDLKSDNLELLYVGQLYPQQTTTAQVCWCNLRNQFKEESPAMVLKRLREMLEGRAAAKDVRLFLRRGVSFEMGAGVWPSGWPQFDAWWPGLLEAATRSDVSDLDSSLLGWLNNRAARAKSNSRALFLRLGDLYAKKNQWDQAAEHYRHSWEKQIHPEKQNDKRQLHDALFGKVYFDPLPLYLAGDALVRAGREKEGRKLIEQSHWISFADADVRYNFLSALTQRGHKEAARRETELLLRSSEPNRFYSGEAFRRLAVAALERKDYLEAAEGFEKAMLRCLRSNTSFVWVENYCMEPAKIHRLRACALLAAGKIDGAIQQVELALADSPGYGDLAIAVVPELERRGHKKESADLFNRCYDSYEKVCRSYPRCAWAHNAAAWMAACCRRHLDAALQHAEKAVELVPNRAGYLDTLAEVYFQRGDKEKAIALQKRVIELDPKKLYYRKQLKRLEAGNPSADRPPENDE